MLEPSASEALSLDAYLGRIRFTGTPRPDLATLIALHRAHLSEISYENLDIHFGSPLGLGLSEAFRKIVVDGRGGWCFEMNHLFHWALQRIGFNVTLLGGTAAVEGDHVLIRVEINGESHLADMGWGNGFHEPLPLVESDHRQAFRRFALRQDGDIWRFSNLDFGDDGFAFKLEPRTIGDFQQRSDWLQRDPESSFVRVVKGFRFSPDGALSILRGAVLTTFTVKGKAATVIDSADQYAGVWRSVFDSPLTNMADLWPKVHAAHTEWERARSKA